MNKHTLLILLSCLLMPALASAQESASLMIGTEYFRSWGVATDGYSLIPMNLVGRFPLGGSLFLSVGIGYDRATETTPDFADFSREVTPGSPDDGIQSFRQATTIFDQAIAFTPGIRISVPGGPERMRLWLGADAVGVFYPERRMVTIGLVDVVNAQGEVTQFSRTETIGRGYQGYGLGLRAVIGVEWTLLDGLLLGAELGPGINNRYRDPSHDFVTTGVSRVLPNPDIINEWTGERTGLEGVEYQAVFRFRGLVYLGWEF